MIIGFAGYARAGKHEAARALEPEFEVHAFADILRNLLYTLNPILDVYHHSPKDVEKYWSITSEITLQTVIDEYSWEGYKDTKYSDEIRRLIQTLGTDCGRGLLGEDIWINRTLEAYDNDISGRGPVWSMADVRFPNEAQAIWDRGGKVIWIEKPGVGPVNNHASEHSLRPEDCDWEIWNDGTVDELHHTVRAVVSQLKN